MPLKKNTLQATNYQQNKIYNTIAGIQDILPSGFQLSSQNSLSLFFLTHLCSSQNKLPSFP